jgi:hypothetical protein
MDEIICKIQQKNTQKEPQFHVLLYLQIEPTAKSLLFQLAIPGSKILSGAFPLPASRVPSPFFQPASRAIAHGCP